MMTGNHSSTPTKAPWNHITPSASFFHWNQAVDPASCREVCDALRDSTSTSWPAAPRPTPLKVPAEPHRAHAFSSIRRHAPSSFLMASPTLLGRPSVRCDEPKPLARTQQKWERERSPQCEQANNGTQGRMAHREGCPEQATKPTLVVREQIGAT